MSWQTGTTSGPAPLIDTSALELVASLAGFGLISQISGRTNPETDMATLQVAQLLMGLSNAGKAVKLAETSTRFFKHLVGNTAAESDNPVPAIQSFGALGSLESFLAS